MTSISITKGDITVFDGDAIVNAANRQLVGGGGVDGAIHRAGGPTILDECRRWVDQNGPLPTGQAMITGGGDLTVRLVIHTVGPVWGQYDGETARSLLASCYQRSLDLAAENDCVRVAFPSISTGAFGFPKREAAETALTAVRDWIAGGPGIDEIVFVSFGDENHQIYDMIMRGDDPPTGTGPHNRT